MTSHPPVVLVFAGLDPSGGAGLQADIEALASAGCHAAPIATCLTVQDSHRVHRLEAVAGELIAAQAQAVLADLPVSAIKIGAMGSVAAIRAIAAIIAAHPALPVVLDPVLAAGAGQALADDAMLATLSDLLLAKTTLITPNSLEARRLAPAAAALAEAAADLLDRGVAQVLITGTHEPGKEVTNTLYSAAGAESFHWPRLDGEYHGSGCTLAASIAAGLAKGMTMRDAVQHAQAYTHAALSDGWRPGDGQWLPRRRHVER